MKNKREGVCSKCGLIVKSFAGLLIKIPQPERYNYKLELFHRECAEAAKPKRFY